jgi:hypothetical protein
MLRRILSVVVVMALAGAIWLVPVSAQTRPNFLTATGQEIMVGGAVVFLGNVTCVGGQPSGSPDPYDPCTKGTRRILLRDTVVKFRYEKITGGAAELFGGTNTLTMNWDLDPNLAGPIWGTFKWVVKSPFLGDPGETWEGVLFGYFDVNAYAASYELIGVGIGGRLEGRKLHIHLSYPGMPVMDGTFTAQITESGR